MPRINILDKSIFNRIAAGEVVEKPASVVKELVENSIDANATSVTIEVKGGGIASIKVIDNGCGIYKDDFHKVFLPHATSKIATIEDLDKIGTLGFRGEALSSISSVSKVTLVSKVSTEDMGYMMSINGGECTDTTPVGCINGTNITVEDLFYNVPARAKFLRKPKQEESDITNYVARLIMANPDITIKYFVDGKLVYHSQGTGLYDAIYAVYGKTIVGNIEKFEYTAGEYKFDGYIGKPTFTKPNRTYQTLIINGRYVINQTISTAVFKAYEPFMMKSSFPFYVLHLSLPLDSVDVNVHPNKLDVKFEDSNKIFGIVFNGINDALFQVSNIKTINSISNTADEDFLSERDKINFEKLSKLSNGFGSAYNSNNDDSSQELKEVDLSISDNNTPEDKKEESLGRPMTPKELAQKIEEMRGELKDCSLDDIVDNDTSMEYEFKKNEESLTDFINHNSLDYRLNNDNSLLNDLAKQATFKDYSLLEKVEQECIDEVKNIQSFKVVGVAFNTYIIVEQDNRIYFIDQHAGHERILFDSLMSDYQNKTMSIQDLLVPYVFDLNTQEFQHVLDNRDMLANIGFLTEIFGNNSIKVSTVPSSLSNINMQEFIDEILTDLSSDIHMSKVSAMREKFASAACKAAIKANDRLSDTEIRMLLDKLFAQGQVLLCPHGRPIIIEIKKTDIEKWFKRIV